MNTIINWLSKRPLVNLGLVIFYFLAVVLPHKRFGSWLNSTFLGKLELTLDQYNQYVAIAAGIILVLGITQIFQSLRKNKSKNKIIFYLIVSIAFAVIIIKTLFFVNIETVHFPQYACFAILIFPIVKRYQSALIWATIAGAFDEAYQYFYLAPNETGYYDFNDVLTNLIGATFGLIILKSFDVNNAPSPSFFNRSEVKGILFLIVLIVFLFKVNILGMNVSSGANYPLIKKEITSFWTTAAHQVTFHIVRPWEGILATFILWLFYWKLGRE